MRGSTTGPGGFLADNTLWWCEPRIPMNSPNMPKFAQQSTQPSEPTEQVAKPNMRVCVRSMASGGPTPIGICLQGLLPDPEPSPRSVSGSVLVAPRTKNSKFEWFYSISGFYSISADFFTLPSRELTTREETPYTRPAGEVPPGIDSALPHTNCASTCAST